MTPGQRPKTESKTESIQITASNSAASATAHRDAVVELAQQHFQLGWWSLLFFVALGIVLETLHAFKVSAYLNVGNETRRLMWTLAHAHGTLLALVHVAFGATVALTSSPQSRSRCWASRCLTYSAWFIPLGFLLGGLDPHGGDPGLGVLLVPVGAALLLVAIVMTAVTINR